MPLQLLRLGCAVAIETPMKSHAAMSCTEQRAPQKNHGRILVRDDHIKQYSYIYNFIMTLFASVSEEKTALRLKKKTSFMLSRPKANAYA